MVPSVNNAVYDSTINLARYNKVPKPAWCIFKIVHCIHRTWSYYRRAKIYKNPNNFAHLALGHTVNVTIGDLTSVKVAAQWVYIASRILAAIDQYEVLYQACREIGNAFMGRYPKTIVRPWVKNSSCFSPSFLNGIKRIFVRTAERIKRIAVSIFNMFKHIFILSMCLMDSINAFYYTDHTERVSEVFVNAKGTIEGLMKTQEALLEQLKNNQKTIETIFEKLKLPNKFSDLTSAIEENIKKTQTVQSVLNAGNGFGREAGVISAYTFAHTLGLHEKLPSQFVPAHGKL